MKKTLIGIDQSLNSTGVTVIRDNQVYFYIITNHRTKKKTNLPANLKLIYIDKEPLPDDQFELERVKYRNVVRVVEALKTILEPLITESEVEVHLEGISFGSRNTRALDELCALNYFIRQLCEKSNIQYKVIPPSKVKKYATGIGNANKDVILDAFCALFPQYSDLRTKIKLDDVADSYFIAVFES